jgi:hypothetical protein
MSAPTTTGPLNLAQFEAMMVLSVPGTLSAYRVSVWLVSAAKTHFRNRLCLPSVL